MPRIITIWLKEIRDTLRDRRTLYAMVLAPLVVMPVITVGPQKFMESQIRSRQEETIKLAIEGADHAPALMAYLAGTGQVQVLDVSDVEEALQKGEIQAALIIPPDFDQALAQEEPAQVTLLCNEAKMASGIGSQRLQLLLEAYGRQVLEVRLRARGIEPGLLTPIEVKTVNVATEQQMGGFFLAGLLPMFIALWALIGGMYTTIDVTAGEKERGTLEPLLVTPASRTEIVLGKLLAVFAMALVTTVLGIGSLYFSFQAFPPMSLTRGGGQAVISLPLSTVLLLFATSLPLVAMLNSLELALCTIAKTFKEAQNYIVPLQFVVILPALPLLLVPDLVPPVAAYALPVFGSILTFKDLLLGTADGFRVALTVATALVYAALSLGLTVFLFTREQVLFRV